MGAPKKSTFAYGLPGSRGAPHRGGRIGQELAGARPGGTIGGRADRHMVSRLGASSPRLSGNARGPAGSSNDQLKPVPARGAGLTVFPPFYTASRGEAGSIFDHFKWTRRGVAATAGPVFSRFKRAARGVAPGCRRLFFPCLSVSRRGLRRTRAAWASLAVAESTRGQLLRGVTRVPDLPVCGLELPLVE